MRVEEHSLARGSASRFFRIDYEHRFAEHEASIVFASLHLCVRLAAQGLSPIFGSLFHKQGNSLFTKPYNRLAPLLPLAGEGAGGMRVGEHWYALAPSPRFQTPISSYWNFCYLQTPTPAWLPFSHSRNAVGLIRTTNPSLADERERRAETQHGQAQ
jgi:hypothetical protein